MSQAIGACCLYRVLIRAQHNASLDQKQQMGIASFKSCQLQLYRLMYLSYRLSIVSAANRLTHIASPTPPRAWLLVPYLSSHPPYPVGLA